MFAFQLNLKLRHGFKLYNLLMRNWSMVASDPDPSLECVSNEYMDNLHLPTSKMEHKVTKVVILSNIKMLQDTPRRDECRSFRSMRNYMLLGPILLHPQEAN